MPPARRARRRNPGEPLVSPRDRLRDLVANEREIPGEWRRDAAEAIERALAAGARPPLTYMGIGMIGVVFCDAENSYKVARALGRVSRTEEAAGLRMLEEEGEWFHAAMREPFVRKHAARFVAWDPDAGVLVKECIFGSPGGWADEGELYELHKEIERRMLPLGWTAPEFKSDSYVFRRRTKTPVLVDATMPNRVGEELLRYAEETVAGERRWPESLKDVGFYIVREVGKTVSPESAARALRGFPPEVRGHLAYSFTTAKKLLAGA